MKEIKTLLLLTLIVTIVACDIAPNNSKEKEKYKVKDLTDSERMIWDYYSKQDTLIFRSSQNEFDTIVIEEPKEFDSEVRSFSRGYYNTKSWSIYSHLTKGSYHKAGNESSEASRRFINFHQKGEFYGFREFIFLQLHFQPDFELLNSEKVVIFNAASATHKGYILPEGINSFTLSIDEGVTSFVDDRLVEWTRVSPILK